MPESLSAHRAHGAAGGVELDELFVGLGREPIRLDVRLHANEHLALWARLDAEARNFFGFDTRDELKTLGLALDRDHGRSQARASAPFSAASGADMIQPTGMFRRPNARHARTYSRQLTFAVTVVRDV